MRTDSKQINPGFKYRKKTIKFKPVLTHVKICEDYLNLFGYRILALFRTKYLLHVGQPKNSFLIVAIDKNGNKCFLLMFVLHKNEWFMEDISTCKYLSKSTKVMLELFINKFLKQSQPSHFLILPSLFLDVNRKALNDVKIPEHLNIFRSAK
jgi:hypothetical protein